MPRLGVGQKFEGESRETFCWGKILKVSGKYKVGEWEKYHLGGLRKDPPLGHNKLIKSVLAVAKCPTHSWL